MGRYSRRSCLEVNQNFRRWMSEADFSKGAASWNLPRSVTEEVVFVAYFVTESDLEKL